MKPHPRVLLLLIPFTAVVLSSCVSVKLTPDVQKAKGLSYRAPGGAFSEVSLPAADKAWKSSKTGNTISYFSECSGGTPSLEQMRDDVMGSLPKAQILASDVIQHDDREGLLSLIEGRLEGIPMRISLLVYVKNGCRYSLSLTGRKTVFDSELPEFTAFEKGFKAP